MMLGTSIAVGVALAQPHPTRIRDADEARPNLAARNSDSEAQRVLVDYGMCVVRRNRRSVDAYIAAPAQSRESERLAARIATEECLESGTLRFGSTLFRGALFNALYQVDFPAQPASNPSAAARVVYVPGETATLSAEQRDWRSLTGFADCVVRAVPAQSRELIMAGVTTPQERAVWTQIRPHLGPCLPQGIELQFTRTVLRGLIAESLYRLTTAPAAPVAGQ